ncbi:MAG: hypothetical protein HQL80_05790 [Magnetococcales bacterium]|nr:hypothetical protein [Magnetococcales bacterium]MBF0583732.1 hypothetical protein [Magnetococcales bacterium]
MVLELTPERIAAMLLEFAAAKLREGITPAAVEEELVKQGAQVDVAKMLVDRAVETVKSS